ncbi:terpenoid synthase [Fistulina hepatica ATCC 64428]|uniref:Terpenoid synthase n=1 Tax=Fistulina hepatica ATCC 64428 TaxID=1128425 RepID=A0A0D7AJV4_9AGAR|nr:terpenoid synthase [Fistulina hepatica ATCC 64428]
MEPVEIRGVISDFLQRCAMIYPTCDKHAGFEAECIAVSVERGYIKADDKSFRYSIKGGVSMACNAYGHLKNRRLQTFICLYTAFLIYLDDMFDQDVESVREFNHRFVTGQKQRHWLLDHFAALLLEMPNLWGPVVANMMTTSTLNLVTALSLEHELQGVTLESDAVRYPTFARVMSGASETYALFAFPPELPLRSYLQALPDLMIYINNGNDILSFYKEELDGETVNRVHMIAKCRSVPQSVVLRDIVDDAVAAHRRITGTLEPWPAAQSAFLSFSQGYVGFHAGITRYRLNELGL